MLGAISRWVAAALGWGTDAEEEDEDERRFLPSPLDISVRYAHGGSTSEVERELGKIEEEARNLEDERRGG